MSIPRVNASSKERDALLHLEEDHFVDLKSRRTLPRDLQKHLVAFANTDGGDIYVGIEDPRVRGRRIRGFAKPEAANDVLHALAEVTPTIDESNLRGGGPAAGIRPETLVSSSPVQGGTRQMRDGVVSIGSLGVSCARGRSA